MFIWIILPSWELRVRSHKSYLLALDMILNYCNHYLYFYLIMTQYIHAWDPIIWNMIRYNLGPLNLFFFFCKSKKHTEPKHKLLFNNFFFTLTIWKIYFFFNKVSSCTLLLLHKFQLIFTLLLDFHKLSNKTDTLIRN